jgi:hypothetical protein
MRRSLRLGCAAVPILAALVAVACGDDDDTGGEPFTLLVSPEFVQGVIPDTPISVLAAVESEDDTPVTIAASYNGGDVEVEPAEIAPGEVAEVTFVARPGETATELTISATRGGLDNKATRSFVVFPWEDDREETARDLLALFLQWLDRTIPRLGIGPDRDFDGVFVAPQLLVVSHYEFFDSDYELGLSWHVMIAPDDWAELYIRPRYSFHPVRAFRLSSWSTALAGGEVEFTEVPPPAEVVR